MVCRTSIRTDSDEIVTFYVPDRESAEFLAEIFDGCTIEKLLLDLPENLLGKSRTGTDRIHQSDADRQKAYRDRHRILMDPIVTKLGPMSANATSFSPAPHYLYRQSQICREISMLRDWLWTVLRIPKLSENTLNELIEYSVRSSSQLNNEILSELALVAGKEPYDVIKRHQERVEEEGNRFPLRPIITDR